MRNKVGVLIESDFYEPEIEYYSKCFDAVGLEVHFLTRLWGNAELTFEGHEERKVFKCKESFETADLKEYVAVIVPAGQVMLQTGCVTLKILINCRRLANF